ncbi:MAG TPA: Cys-tRNA(Pro) deacylase [Geobacteraceae bacterium]|nr:Cys-tRNA(Pro) deacylase [Geobacteraceae bacterium]
MAKDKTPATPAVRMLRDEKVAFSDHHYSYEERGGTSHPARELGLDEHSVIKTLIMEDDRGNPLIVLMHGDRQVSTKELARLIGVKSVSPCAPETAGKHSGYMVGGTSPFGTRKKMPVYMEETILRLPEIYINGGKRGFLVCLSPRDAARILKPVLVKVAIDG